MPRKQNISSIYAVKKGRTPGIYTTWADCKAQTQGYSGPIYKKCTDQREARVYMGYESGGGVSLGPTAWYAVKIGLKVGVYTSWEECSEQIRGYKGAKYQKFTSKREAEIYLGYVVTDTETSHGGVVPDDPDTQHVYTDGSCIGNGQKGCRAGYGIYFGENDPRNRGLPIPPEETQTNNRGEMTAIVETIEMLEPDVREGRVKRVIIHTDSKYSIDTFERYACQFESRGWRTSGGDVPANLDLIKRGASALEMYPDSFQFHHVKAHTGASDVHSRGNHEADRLAVKGATRI